MEYISNKYRMFNQLVISYVQAVKSELEIRAGYQRWPVVCAPYRRFFI